MSEQNTFAQLQLRTELLETLGKIGYETPSPIQGQSIPQLLKGHDLIGQAQTGTGKTAAFALPLLNNIDLSHKAPRVIVLTPTRELAVQVAESFSTYAQKIKGTRVLAVYGGADMSRQIRELKKGVHIVVGTPGRVMDHIERKTLQLDEIQSLVLDEADEMLRMGFIDDVEWILKHTPKERQTILFSATMPKPIQKIAGKYLVQPKEVKIETSMTAAQTVNQRFLSIPHKKKVDALARILESEKHEGVIVFMRTRHSATQFAEILAKRGYDCRAIHGDIRQGTRERTIQELKSGKINILFATDVAARGLDVDRVSHVINFDIPYDVESYVHRIGRTGRAGRTGEAILFVTNQEKNMLKQIEKATKKKIDEMHLPTDDEILKNRQGQLFGDLEKEISDFKLKKQIKLLRLILEENEYDLEVLSAALLKMLQDRIPEYSDEVKSLKKEMSGDDDSDKSRGGPRRSRSRKGPSGRKGSGPRGRGKPSSRRAPSKSRGSSRKRR